MGNVKNVLFNKKFLIIIVLVVIFLSVGLIRSRVMDKVHSTRFAKDFMF